MIDYNNISNAFCNKFISKNIKTKYKDIFVNWSFEPYPNIISKPNFITYLQTSSKLKFSYLMIESIENKIDQLRELFNKTNKACQTYLSETQNDEFCKIQYNKFLLNCYSTLKEFINNSLIQWIFCDALKENWIEFNKQYNHDYMYDYQFLKLEISFQKNLFNILKSISKKIKNDYTFKLLIDAYVIDLEEKQNSLIRIKNELKTI
ncbi:hypothetical protein [Mycoplasma sp. HU2014]|uniref:hypothetical protein n=1 Tax=Mycoplasma sp. HU2014 TaxID=1664275 RepID=UPI00067AF4E1|nr:hypothetical protein [Mycoplasma sp. HU2014]KNG79410.1 hypothetical protein AB668_02315 [Mycoplasma sp. HU2014]